MASSAKPSPTANTKPNRLPAPTLFVGPPSRNASQLSVSRQPNDVKGRDALNRQQSSLRKALDPDSSGSNDRDSTGRDWRKPSESSVDAKWREMQSVLNDVELTAQSSTHVFGESHAAALDALRRAQIELARAWGRGNDKASAGNDDRTPELNVNRFGGADDLASDRARLNRKRTGTETSQSTTLSDESLRSSEDNGPRNTAKDGRSQLEDETAEDIRLASERRAANEAYFQKVDTGVKDVVAKLEAVAKAMRGVEGESRSLWSASERSSNDDEPITRQSDGGAKDK